MRPQILASLPHELAANNIITLRSFSNDDGDTYDNVVKRESLFFRRILRMAGCIQVVLRRQNNLCRSRRGLLKVPIKRVSLLSKLNALLMRNHEMVALQYNSLNCI